MSGPVVFMTKLGRTRAGERSRIWIEGKRLADHKFTVGTRFLKVWGDNRLVLTADPPKGAPRSAVGTVSGKGDKPIIDIAGARVMSTFTGTQVQVTYRNNLITIRGSNNGG